MQQLADILNLNIATAFSQLDIGRAIEVLLSPSKLIFLYQDNFKIAFKFEKLKFFDLELFEKYNTDNLIHSHKNTIYKNMHLFIECIRNIVRIKILIIVQIHLSICLRKTALS
jgi:hypothetical protein